MCGNHHEHRCASGVGAPPLDIQLREHDGAILMTPKVLPQEHTMVPYHLTLRFMLRTCLGDCREIHVHFHNMTIAIQQMQIYLQYDIQKHTYIHAYIQTPLAFNILMWGLLRLAPIIPTTQKYSGHPMGIQSKCIVG